MYIARSTEQSITKYQPGKAYGGYAMFAPHATKDVWLIDIEGRIVHHWKPSGVVGERRAAPAQRQHDACDQVVE